MAANNVIAFRMTARPAGARMGHLNPEKTMSLKLLLLYFVVGGLIVSGITYLGSLGKSQWAAFLAFLPSISVITLISIYYSGGSATAAASPS